MKLIQDIFLPEKIHTYYLFSQKIIAFEVNGSSLFATVMRAHRNKRSLQRLVEESYNIDDPESLIIAIKAILKKVGSYDQAYIALPSSVAVFKALELPFISLEKIKLILPFEVESLLPFGLQDAVIDGIVTATDAEKKSSEVFVVALKQTLLDIAVAPFIAAGVHPSKVTLGALELYGLVQHMFPYHQQRGVSFIIDLHATRTTLLLLVDGKLKTIRALPEGFSEEFLRLHHDASAEQLHQHAPKFFADITFSVQAMLKGEQLQTPVASALLVGPGAQLHGFSEFMNVVLGCSCTVFHANKILHNGIIVLEQGGSIAPEFVTSIATVLSSDITEQFNLGRIYDEPEQLKLFKKQVIVMGFLWGLMLISFFIYSFLTLKSLRSEVDQSKLEVARKLRDAFGPSIKADQVPKSLDTLIRDAESKEENIWFALSPNNRYSYLRYLYELTSRINRDELGLMMKRLSIKSDEREGKDTLTFEGTVRDYPALKTLEKNLRETKLFEYVPEPQDTSFTFVLAINKNQQELA